MHQNQKEYSIDQDMRMKQQPVQPGPIRSPRQPIKIKDIKQLIENYPYFAQKYYMSINNHNV